MTDPEFKKIARLLKEAYKELEIEAVNNGVDIFSDEFKQAQDAVRLAILSKYGFTLEEYRIIKDSIASANKKRVESQITEVKEKIEEVASREQPRVFSLEEIESIARGIAEEYIKPPQIINKIVKETIVSEPQIFKETKEITNNVAYDDSKLIESLQELNKRFDDAKPPEPIDMEEVKLGLREEFEQNLKESIEILGMPDFRKLAMGLQNQIDELASSSTESSNITELTNDVIASGSGVVSAIVASASEDFAFKGVISPPSFGTRQDNYNPTGLATATTIRLNATSSFVNITGIAGGYAGRVLILQNISNFNIQLAGESPFSSAANQFEKVYNSSEGIHIPPYSQTTIYYDGVSSKWRTQYPGILDITTTMGSLSRTGGRYFVDLDLEMGHENNWSARQNFLEFYAMGSLFTVDIDNKRYVLNENETSYFEIDSGSGLFDLNASQSDLRLGDIVNDTQKLIISPSSVNNRTQLGNITAGHQLDIDTANNNTKLGNTSSGTYLEIDHNSGLYYLRGLPTSDPGVTGALWLNGKVIESSP